MWPDRNNHLFTLRIEQHYEMLSAELIKMYVNRVNANEQLWFETGKTVKEQSTYVVLIESPFLVMYL